MVKCQKRAQQFDKGTRSNKWRHENCAVIERMLAFETARGRALQWKVVVSEKWQF